jgi:MFS family permease
LRRDVNASLWDASAFAVMVGIGEMYVPAFVLALGHGPVLAGLVAALPMLAGALLQLASPLAVRALGSHRRWVVLSTSLQALCIVPYVVGALRGSMGALAVFATASLYWAFGQGSGPAWNTWIARLIPGPARPRYFARRTRLSQAATIVALAGGGWLLEEGAASGHALIAFAGTFGVALVARVISARSLGAQSEPAGPLDEHPVPLGRFVRRLWKGQDGRLVLYMVLVQAAVYVAGPFFTPFMLGELELSYLAYVGLVATAYVARIVAMPLLGDWAERHGPRRVLWVGGIGIVPLSVVWAFSQTYWHLMVFQALSGLMWGAYELATQLLFFETIRREERTSVLTYFNVVNAGAILVGSLVGGALLAGFGGRRGYFVLFAVSFVGRLATLLLLPRVAETPHRVKRLVTRVLAVGAVEGPAGPAVVPSIEEELVRVHAAQRAGDRRTGTR